MKIWVDADACPNAIKEMIYKTSLRLQIPVYFVAHSFIKIPQTELIHFIQVKKDFDGADTFIIENLHENDLVITADIPMAQLAVNKGSIAINPRGEQYTESTISEKLSLRNFMQVLREGRIIQGGAGEFSNKDKQSFAASLDKYTTLLLKKDKTK